MKETRVAKGPVVEIVDTDVPKPAADQVLIKVVVSGTNPKDWKFPEMRNMVSNTGDDIAGVVESVGENVFEFKKGDRVAAFHEIATPGGSFAEYAVAPENTTIRIPKSLSFEDAATIPLTALTAAEALFRRLALPQPWLPTTETTETPLIIYGASTSVGYFAIQLAIRSKIHPILAIAGRATDSVKGLLDASKGDVVVDYRDGQDAVIAALSKALDGKPPIKYAFDTIADSTSSSIIGGVIEKAGDGKSAKATFVSPPADLPGLPSWVERSMTFVGSNHKDGKDFGYIYSRYLARGLEQGWLRSQKVEVVPGGLGGVQTALENLKSGKVSAVKYVVRIAETEGIQA